MVKDNQKVIIIGCGMAGLAAAMQLSKKGLEVEVHEKLQRLVENFELLIVR